MEQTFFKKKSIANEKSKEINHPAGNLFEEINDQDMSFIAGGFTDKVSKKIAKKRGMKGYGGACTFSAECNFTQSCW